MQTLTTCKYNSVTIEIASFHILYYNYILKKALASKQKSITLENLFLPILYWG